MAAVRSPLLISHFGLLLENSDEPIIISDNSFRIIYKNAQARKCIKRPRLGTVFFNFLTAESKVHCPAMAHGGNSCFVSFKSGEYKRALAYTMIFNGERYCCLLFFNWAQIDGTGLLTPAIEENIIRLISDMSGEFDECDIRLLASSHSGEQGKSSNAYSRLCSVLRKDISLFLHGQNKNDAETVRSVRTITSVIEYLSCEVFAKMGFDLTIHSISPEYDSMIIRNFACFLPVYTEIISSVLDSSRMKHAELFITCSCDKLYLDLYYSPQHEISEVPKTIQGLVSSFPLHRLGMAVCAELCRCSG